MISAGKLRLVHDEDALLDSQLLSKAPMMALSCDEARWQSIRALNSDQAVMEALEI